jgi:hypothetical protein
MLVGLVVRWQLVTLLYDDIGDLSLLRLLRGRHHFHILLILVDRLVRPRIEHHRRLVSVAAIPPLLLSLRLPALPRC